VVRAWLHHAERGALLATERARLKDTIVWELERGARLTGPELSHAEATRTQLYDRVRVFFETYEFLVLPTTQLPPFDVRQPYPTEVQGQPMHTYIDWMKSCYYISTVGNPAISVPAGFTDDGLPVGLQIVGRHQDEWGVLQLAHAFEQANGVGAHRPAVAFPQTSIVAPPAHSSRQP
jgi:amidase